MVNHPRRSKKTASSVSLPPDAKREIPHNHSHNQWDTKALSADYEVLATAMQRTFNIVRDEPQFRVALKESLFDVFLAHLPEEVRQYHNCSACRHFFKRYGNLVTITPTGEVVPSIWPSYPFSVKVPEIYHRAIKAIYNKVANGRVVGLFLSPLTTWGYPVTGDWTHFYVTPGRPYEGVVKTANQAMAAKFEDFKTIRRALSEFRPDTLTEALRVLESDRLFRSERFLGPIRWLIETQNTCQAHSWSNFDPINRLWRAVATAPEGFCHPRSSVIGTLLEDIAAGYTFSQVKARFDAKVHPLQYQRPQAAPAAGNVKRAEDIVAKLGIARSLERRFARLDEVKAFWSPKGLNTPETELTSGGVFSHLQTKDQQEVTKGLVLPDVTLTWAKFYQTVLPEAEKIEFLVPHQQSHFGALLTATHPDAPPILKWDQSKLRNPVSWYVYHGGSFGFHWSLVSGSWCPVTAIVSAPWNWYEMANHLGSDIILLLQGAVDKTTGQGNALFPEMLRGDLHEVRATIEAYSRTAKLTGQDRASACGIVMPKQGRINYHLRVTIKGRVNKYIIDRWD